MIRIGDTIESKGCDGLPSVVGAVREASVADDQIVLDTLYGPKYLRLEVVETLVALNIVKIKTP